MTIRLTCRQCKGTGTIPNEDYEICRSVRSAEIRRHFHVHAKAEELESDGDNSMDTAECGQSRTVPCPQCNGEGILEFDEESWDLTVTGSEDTE
jgi:hypothetical protein